MTDENIEPQCHYCGKTDEESELRPYGPKGSWVCFPCAHETPERTEQAKQAFYTLLDANSEIGSGVVVIGEKEGPRPFDPKELDRR